MSAREVCREHNISEQSFYRWKARYGGMGVSEIKRLKELERKHAELKKLKPSRVHSSRTVRHLNARPSIV